MSQLPIFGAKVNQITINDNLIDKPTDYSCIDTLYSYSIASRLLCRLTNKKKHTYQFIYANLHVGVLCNNLQWIHI